MRKEAIAARTAIHAARARVIQAEESGQEGEVIANLRGMYRETLVRHWPTIDEELALLGAANRKGK